MVPKITHQSALHFAVVCHKSQVTSDEVTWPKVRSPHDGKRRFEVFVFCVKSDGLIKTLKVSYDENQYGDSLVVLWWLDVGN